jgi:hypothetical protein
MLLGPMEDRRQLQDSPILGDVWVKFGKEPDKPTDLLISPHRDQHAGDVAKQILDALIPDLETATEPRDDFQIAFLQGLVVASLTFEEVIQFIVPKTKWWAQRWRPKEIETVELDPTTGEAKKVTVGTHDLESYTFEEIKKKLETIFKSVEEWRDSGTSTTSEELEALDRFIGLTGLLLWARDHEVKEAEAVLTTLSQQPVPAEAAVESEAESKPESAAAPPSEGPAETGQESGGEQPSESGTAPPENGAESTSGNGSPESPNGTSEPPPTNAEQAPTEPVVVRVKPKTSMSVEEQIDYILDHAKPEEIARLLDKLKGKMLSDRDSEGLIKEPEVLVWQVSLNRQPMPALTKSIPAVKADAAHTLFKVDCSGIAWAVIDSGIDGNHPALKGRVKKSYDFKNYRKIVNVSNTNQWLRNECLKKLKDDSTWLALKNPPTDQEAQDALEKLAKDAAARGPIHWELVEKFVEINPGTPPRSNHGTHVAGIIGANRQAAIDDVKAKAGNNAERAVKAAEKRIADFADGMCPDIQLYDFRVLGKEIKDWEFAIIAALQFIRYLNDRHNFIAIHGANLSLSIPHDIRNFACGRTPICNECERLIESGVVVVTAAGNHGYKSFETKEGSYESYAAFSITDPGNADGVITVGATHRFWPHTYGVSFFSSRGPTGDGRLKPDLVAPGEKIRAPVPGNTRPGGEWTDLDGTSMAAPHVSGAAAMLMARYSEFIGQPRRIKRILCENATDLGRERSFQGHGMLDVLRAFQSV